jgi:hypothetical protein
VPASFPAQDPARVREMVAVSHGNVARVRELLGESPALARATWDWGFGDWETALGAASHVGNREIAHLLIDAGARPDLFTFAMFGQLDIVKAYVAANPGIQRIAGPHSLTLMHHARKGGPESQAVLDYLTTLGDADIGPAVQPITDADLQALVGEYRFADGDAGRLSVTLKEGTLSVKRLPEGMNRPLFHLGRREFHPAGSPAVRLRFEGDGPTAAALVVVDGPSTLTARRDVG